MLLLLLLLALFINNLQAGLPSIARTVPDITGKRGSIESHAIDIKGRLVFVHVIFRHGDRTPIKPYPTDPWKNRKEWTTGWGQLTNLGKQQQYLLGQWLRKRYDNLLSSTYYKGEIYIRSTDVDRTLMSALSSLAGLYPPNANDTWNNKIDWQPIPVHTVPERSDFVLAAKEPCPAYDYEYSSLMNSAEFNKLNEKYSYLYKYLTEHTGHKVSTFSHVLRINDTLFIESLNNKTLPKWTSEIYPSADMSYLSELAHDVRTYTRKMARLKTGPLINEMLQRFDQKAKGKLLPDRNVWIYSAHDSTLVNVLNTLKIKKTHRPEYGACIMLELRIGENEEPFVSAFYKSSVDAELEILNIPECGITCPLEKMFSLYDDILPRDWKAECKYSRFKLAIGIIMAMLTVMLFIICIYKGKPTFVKIYKWKQNQI